MTKYQVVREDNGPRNPHTGLVKSGFQTREDAQTYIDRATKRLRKQPGCATAWHPYRVEEVTVNKKPRTYGVELFDGGMTAGDVVIKAGDLPEALEKAIAWAQAGDWDHLGQVEMVISRGKKELLREWVAVGVKGVTAR